MSWTLFILLGYLLGSIPFGVLIARARGVDIRATGSRNIGATNVGRVLGRRFGIACFALDLVKGAAPVLAAGAWHGLLVRPAVEIGPAESLPWLAVAAAAVAGHMASIYLRFAGGKGVATSFGAMLAMWPLLTLPAIGALVTWYAVLRLSRIVSAASLAAAASLPLWAVASLIPSAGAAPGATIARAWPPILVTALLALLVAWRHRANIGRLRRGEEPRIGASPSVNDR